MAHIPFKFKGLFCLMHNRFLKTSASSPTLLSSYTVQFLINSCGLPLKTALSAAKILQLDHNHPQKHESVLILLKSHGFSDTHIAKLIAKHPGTLQSNADQTLKPKINCLIENGFSGLLIPDLIASNPTILKVSLSYHLKPCLDFLKTYLGTNEKVVAAVKRSSRVLTSYGVKVNMQPNIDFLISEGVPINSISKLIVYNPRILLQKADRMVRAVNTVKQLGFQPNAIMFVHAVRVVFSMSESTWNRKVKFFNSLLGWSEDEVKSAFKRAPIFLGVSEEKIKNVTDFFVNTMKVEAAVLLSYPSFFVFSVEKRMRPRYNVLKILESKKLLKEGTKIVWTFTHSENIFLQNYVIKHLDQVPNLMELYLYRGTIPANKTDL